MYNRRTESQVLCRMGKIKRWLDANAEKLGTERGHVRFLWEGRKIKFAVGETGDLEELE